MSLDVLFINKAEEIAKKQHNVDLLQSTQDQSQLLATPQVFPNTEPKGTLVNIPVVTKGQEIGNYVMRMGEKMPTFNYWPRGKEIIHRLIMRAAMAEDLQEFILVRETKYSERK